MDFVSKRIDIARRISNAEIKYREIILKTFGSAAPASDKKPDPTRVDDDKKVAKVMQECIAPRLERLRVSYFGSHQQYSVSDWWGVDNRYSFDHDFWTKTTEWQLLEYEHDARKLLGDYDKDMAALEKVEPITKAYRAALAKAVERAQVEPPLNDSDVTWADVFIIRHLSYDPALKGVINSDWTSSAGRQKLMATIDQLLLEEPHYPPECYYLVLK
ncbi:hypothetical protein FS837_012414 [Tulasnella sp. UAMH 9824]|nr:hypothetical protein FS837_012414 [Tulasnella sp. UAMH 9824]